MFRGGGPTSNTQEFAETLVIIKEEIRLLDDYEKMIDSHKQVKHIKRERGKIHDFRL